MSESFHVSNYLVLDLSLSLSLSQDTVLIIPEAFNNNSLRQLNYQCSDFPDTMYPKNQNIAK
jgi:hypothetical protein